MTHYDSNVYYNPQEHGLEVLHLIERGMSYEFDMLAVWRRLSDGALFWATDSGCSCPEPFEDYGTVADLTPLTAESYPGFFFDAKAYADQVSELDIDTVLHDIQTRLGIFAGATPVAN